MINLEINKHCLEQIINSQKIGEGRYGSVYNYNNLAYKIYTEYVPFIERDAKIYDKNIFYYKKMLKIISKQENIKLTTLPIGIITYKKTLVGDILPIFDGNDFNIYAETHNKLGVVLDKVYQAYYELLKNHIYYYAIHEGNIIVDKEGTPHIIDFDPKIIECGITKKLSNEDECKMLFNKEFINLQSKYYRKI